MGVPVVAFCFLVLLLLIAWLPSDCFTAELSVIIKFNNNLGRVIMKSSNKHTNKPAIKVGDRFLTNCHGMIEVIEYHNANNIIVRFDEDGYIRKANSGNIQKGKVKNPNIPTITHKRRSYENFKINDRKQNTKGYWFTIVKWVNAQHIEVVFDSGYKTKATSQAIRLGTISDNYSPSLYKGYLGDLEFYKGKNISKTKEYSHWHAMMSRCFSEDYRSKFPTYEGVSCCEEWLNFSVFAEWCRNQPAFNSEYKLNLDKDIVKKHNKLYSPDYCELVPHLINGMFVKAEARRGDYPIGVYYCNTKNKIMACIGYEDKSIGLGSFTNEVDAFNAYKKRKEQLIKERANQFKHVISQRCYDALMNYQVEITD